MPETGSPMGRVAAHRLMGAYLQVAWAQPASCIAVSYCVPPRAIAYAPATVQILQVCPVLRLLERLLQVLLHLRYLLQVIWHLEALHICNVP